MKRSDFYDVKEAAEVLGYHPQTMRVMVRDGKMRAVKRGRKWFFIKEDVDGVLGSGPTTIAINKLEVIPIDGGLSVEVKENLAEGFLD